MVAVSRQQPSTAVVATFGAACCTTGRPAFKGLGGVQRVVQRTGLALLDGSRKIGTRDGRTTKVSTTTGGTVERGRSQHRGKAAHTT